MRPSGLACRSIVARATACAMPGARAGVHQRLPHALQQPHDGLFLDQPPRAPPARRGLLQPGPVHAAGVRVAGGDERAQRARARPDARRAQAMAAVGLDLLPGLVRSLPCTLCRLPYSLVITIGTLGLHRHQHACAHAEALCCPMCCLHACTHASSSRGCSGNATHRRHGGVRRVGSHACMFPAPGCAGRGALVHARRAGGLYRTR